MGCGKEERPPPSLHLPSLSLSLPLPLGLTVKTRVEDSVRASAFATSAEAVGPAAAVGAANAAATADAKGVPWASGSAPSPLLGYPPVMADAG